LAAVATMTKKVTFVVL